MATISSLFVELKLSADTFNNDIKAAAREAKAFEKDTKDLKDSVKFMGEAMSAAGLAIVGSFALAIKSAADFGDEMNDASKRTGLTTEELSKLKLAADTNGTSFDGLTTGLKLLGKNMELAESGSKTQAAAFKAAGITATDLKNANGDVNTILMKLADTFQSSEDGAGKTALAMQLFGKSGTDLIPMLNEGSAGLKAWGDIATETGRVMSAETAAAADAFNDSLTVMEGSLAGVGGAIGSLFIPALTGVFASITDIVNSFREWVTAHPELTTAVAALGLALTGAGGLLLGVTGVLAIMGPLTVAFGVLTAPITIVVAAVAAVVAGLIYFRNEIAGGVAKALSTFLSGIGFIDTAVSNLASAIGLKGMAKDFADASAQVKLQAANLDDMGSVLLTATPAVVKQASAVKDVVDNTKKHTLSLTENTAAQEAAHAKIQAILKGNLADMAKVASDAEAQASRSLNVMTTAWTAAGTTVDNIIKGNNASMVTYLTKVETQTRSSLDIASDDFSAAMGKQITAADTAMKDLKVIEDDAIAARKQAHIDAVTSVKNSAGAIFDAMFLKGEGVFTSLGNALNGGLLSLGRSIFEDVTAALLGPIKEAFDSFFKGLMDGPIKSLGNAVSGIFTHGASGGASAVGGAGSAAGSAGSAGGGASSAGGAASGAMGIVGIAVEALGSIGIILMLKRLEGTMNGVEANTRFTYIELKDTMEQILWPMYNLISWSTDMVTGLGLYLMPIVEATGYTLQTTIHNEAQELKTELMQAKAAIAAGIAQSNDLLARVVDAVKAGGGGGMDEATLFKTINRGVQSGGIRLVASEVKR